MNRDFSYVDDFFDVLPKLYAMPLLPSVLTSACYVSPVLMPVGILPGIIQEAIKDARVLSRAQKEGYKQAASEYEERFKQTNEQYEALKKIFDQDINHLKLIYNELRQLIVSQLAKLQQLDSKFVQTVDLISRKYHLSYQDKQKLLHSSEAHLRAGEVLGFLPLIVPGLAAIVAAATCKKTADSFVAHKAEEIHRNAYEEAKKIYVQKIQLMEEDINHCIEETTKKKAEFNQLNQDMIDCISDLEKRAWNLIVEISEYELKLSYFRDVLQTK